MTLVSTPARPKTRPEESPGEPGVVAYLLGRALDVAVVLGITAAAMVFLKAASGNTLPGGDSWQGTAILCAVLAVVTFLYGGLAGTLGTVGDRAAGMRIVRASDGTRPGFKTGGARALGWTLYLVFTLALGDSGGIESRFVPVRRRPHTEPA